MSFPNRFSWPTLALCAGTLLNSCSHSTPETATATQAEGRPAAPPFPFGSKIDSLNGIAGYTFGQPLSAFPKMRMLTPAPGELTRTYDYEGTTGWFGKHRNQVSTQLCYFMNGKFCRFLAIGHPTLLREEVTYLFGPGQAEGAYKLFWEGRQARAAYVETPYGMGMQGRLDVLSKSYEAELAALKQAQLKAENGQ